MKAILVKKDRSEEEIDAPDGTMRILVPVVVYDEPRPFVRTAETFFQGPKRHIEEDIYQIGRDGKFYFCKREAR